MSRDELMDAIIEKVHIIANATSMRELDIAHVGLREDIEKFSIAHRRRLNFERPVPELKKCGNCNVLPTVVRTSKTITYECPECHLKITSYSVLGKAEAVSAWNRMNIV